MKFQANHMMLLGACLASIAAMGSSAHDWSELTTPGFVFGALGVIGTNIAGFYTRRPNEPAPAPPPVVSLSDRVKYGKRDR